MSITNEIDAYKLYFDHFLLQKLNNFCLVFLSFFNYKHWFIVQLDFARNHQNCQLFVPLSSVIEAGKIYWLQANLKVNLPPFDGKIFATINELWERRAC